MNWWTLLLLALAAYRIFRLLGHDIVLDRPRAKLLRLGNWQEGQRTPPGYRSGLAEFIICPWCLGFWVTIAWWGAWKLWPHATLWLAFPFAISTLVGLLGRIGDSNE